MLHALPILQDGRAWQFIRFSIVGLVSNLCLLLIFALLVQLGAEPVLSSVLVYALGVLGVTAVYAVHRSWSFRSKRAHFKAGPRYLVAHAIGASTQALILFIGHRILKIDPVVVQAAAMVIVAIVLYLLFENFVFGTRLSFGSPSKIDDSPKG